MAGKGALPSLDTLKKAVRRVRRQNGPQIPIAPESLISLEIPDSYKVYEVEPGRMEDFLLRDSGSGLDRILIFGRRRGIEVCN